MLKKQVRHEKDAAQALPQLWVMVAFSDRSSELVSFAPGRARYEACLYRAFFLAHPVATLREA